MVRKKNAPAIQVVKRTSTLVAGPIYCSTMPEANAVPSPSLRGALQKDHHDQQQGNEDVDGQQKIDQEVHEAGNLRASSPGCKAEPEAKAKRRIPFVERVLCPSLENAPPQRQAVRPPDTLQRSVAWDSLKSTTLPAGGVARWFSR